MALYTDVQAADRWSLTGYAKTYMVYEGSPDITLDGTAIGQEQSLARTALRLMLGADVMQNVSLEAHYEIAPVYQLDGSGTFSALSSAAAPPTSTWRYDDLKQQIHSGDDWKITQNLDRLNLRFSLDAGDLTIGRQTISFGAARFVSPSDIFKPFGPAALDTEYRPGVDALRWLGALGDLTEYDIGVVADEGGATNNLVTYARIRTSHEGNDLEAVVIHRPDSVLIGGGWERALGLFGFWSEIAHTVSNREDGETLPGSDYPSDYTRFSIGLDRALSENIFAMVEYHHSTFGTDDPRQYQNLVFTQGYRSGGIYLVGRDYLLPSVSWTATPLLGLSASAFVNLGDRSSFIRIAGEFNIQDNLYTDFGVFLGTGKATALTGSSLPQSTDGSEFGATPTTAWLSLRYYF